MNTLLRTFSLVLLFLGLIYSSNTFGQTLDNGNTTNGLEWVDGMQNPDANFYAIQSSFEHYFNDRKREKGDGWKVFKRWEQHWEPRVNADGSFPAPGYLLQQYEALGNYGFLSTTGTWTQRGPLALPTNGTSQPNGVGRVNDVAFHPTNANIIWAGAPAGGLWKTENGGTTWTGLTDNLPTLGVSTIVIDPTNTNIMYMGTGDRDGGDAPGLGVYKSTDGGATWTASNSGITTRTVHKLLIDPTNTSKLIAATNGGIYMSTNSGVTWLLKSNTSNYKDIAFKPSNYGIIYATSASSSGAAFYRSMDGGLTWTAISTGITSTGSRMVIGVTPANTNVVYLLAGGSSGLNGIYASTNGGSSFSLKANSPNLLGYEMDGSDANSQAYYDLAIAVDPTNANTLYVGGINIWKSINGGTSWTITAHWVGGSGVPSVHADQHCLVFSPSGVLFNGNDGGIYKTSNGGTSWTDLSSGLGVSQIYKIGQSALSPSILIAGFQDNGTAIASGNAWQTVIGGDGMECLIDPTNDGILYGALYYGDIRRSTNSGASFSTIADIGSNGINESGDWVTPYCLREGVSTTMFAGYKNVWRSTNLQAPNSSNVTWTKISNFTSGQNLEVLENSPANSDILYASQGVNLYRCDNANAASPTWTSLGNVGYIITDIEAHPTNANIVYFTAGQNIYKSSDKGATWASIKGNLPNVNMNTLNYYTPTNEAIYVGTDLGVFYKDASMSSWISFSLGLPAAIEVTDLEIYYSANPTLSRISASTYGRGVWTSDVYILTNTAPVAQFTVSTTTPCVGSVTQFSDLSFPSATSWSWTITPSTFSYTGGTNATSPNPKVIFSATGSYTVALTATNAYGFNTLTKTNYITVGTPYSLPNTEDFEGFTVGNPGLWIHGWTYENTGIFNWRANNGTTPTSGTGPDKDHTIGNSAGKYIFTEASSPAAPGDTASLISPCINIPSSGSPALAFWYHMFGSGIMSLHVDVLSNGTWTDDVYLINGPQQGSSTAPWLQAFKSLSSYSGTTIKVRFRVVRGNNQQGDVALDDIQVYLPVTPANDEPCGALTLTSDTVCNYTTFNNVNATLSVGVAPPGCGGTIDQDVWFKVVVPMGGSVEIDAEPVIGSFTDGAMAVYKGTCNNLTLVSCNDDYNGNGNMPFLSVTNQIPGDTLFIRFWKFGAGTGQFQLCVKTLPFFLINPKTINIPYAGGNTNLNVYTASNVTWSVNDNASWLSVSPTLGIGNGIITLTYSANSGSQRTATITGSAAGFNNQVITLTQQSFVHADFTLNSSMVCQGSSLTFTNTSTNGSTYKWYLNGVQSSTSTNFTHTFNAIGTYSIKLVVIGSIGSDSITKLIHVGSANIPNAGSDTSLCEGGTVVFNHPVATGLTGCTTSCNIPSNCASASNNDDSEYITNVNIGNSSNSSLNQGAGSQSFTDFVFKPLVRDSTYTLAVTCFTAGNWPEFADAYIDWNRNGLFDEPAISMGSATFTGSHVFYGIISVPSNATLGKARMRIIMKYGSAIISGCETAYGYGETEDYMIDILGNGNLSHSWTGPAGFSSTQISPVINAITVAQSGSYQLTVVNAYNCQSTDTKVVTVSPYPIVTFSSLSDVCIGSGSVVNLTQGSPVGGTYFGTGVTASVFNPSVAGVGTHSLGYAYTNAAGCGDTAYQTIVVNPSPTVDFTGLATNICKNGGNLTLTGNPAGGSFSGNGISGNVFSPSTAGAGNHAILYSYTNTSGCTGQKSKSITVNPNPVVNAGNDTSINYNTTATLHATYSGITGSVNVAWTPASLVNIPSSLITQTSALTSLTQFQVIVSTASGSVCSDTDQVVVSIMGGPLSINATASPTQVCAGSSVQLNANASGGTGNKTYSWTSNPSGFTSNISNPTANPMVNTWYKVVVTDNNGSLTDSVLVSVYSQVVADFNLPSSACLDGIPIALIGTPSGGVFSGTGVSSSIFTPSVAGLGSHSITYNYTDANGCQTLKIKNILVNPLPVVDMGALASVCNTSPTVSLNQGTPYGGVYSGNGVVGTSFIPTNAGVGSHYIKYTFTSQNGCIASDSSVIAVVSSPSFMALTDKLIAYNTSTAMVAPMINGGSGNYSYLWTPTNKVVNPILAATMTVNLVQSQLFQLTVTDNQSNCTASDEMLVTVSGGALNVTINAPNNVICQGDSTSLTAIASGGIGVYSYKWISSAGGVLFGSTIWVKPNQTTAYSVYAYSMSDSATASIFVIVDNIPQGSLPNQTGVCSNNAISLDAGSGYASYQWSNGASGQVIQVQGQSLPLGFTDFYVTITNANGCTAVDSVSVELSMGPENFKNDTVVCSNFSPITLDGGSWTSYLWSTGDTTQSISFNMSQTQLQMWLEVSNSYGCIGRDTFMVIGVICGSVSEIEQDFIVNVYPNPASYKVTLAIEYDENTKAVLELMDSKGMLVRKESMELYSGTNKHTISLEGLAKGMYMLRVKTERGTVNHRLIKY